MRRLVILLQLFLLATCFCASQLVAQNANPQPAPYSEAKPNIQGYLARIGFNDPDQLSEALDRVQMFFNENGADVPLAPISIVVHGPEVSIFEKDNYSEYKSIVDKAAQLTALGVLDISVCEIRLDSKRIKSQEIYPFIKTVMFGPREVERLLEEENYVYF